ncbi:hypothetical protein Lfu02_55710 [Longispora fulva]|uniref:Uncharacterized protein n=1 Tax=Longispora fulva TaxID=619741 RepID=A0A8J7GU94_9ACTN|nr:hypothetical protein [Longispora fulva]MBG6137446.1 hypothetical protein [Longispora fulva]GIG61199.1 hypothetical protein Lfu02_55710 [Longispora fulva]
MSVEEMVWGWKNPEYREGGHPAGEIVMDPWLGGDGTIVMLTTTTKGEPNGAFGTECG